MNLIKDKQTTEYYKMGDHRTKKKIRKQCKTTQKSSKKKKEAGRNRINVTEN